MTGREPEIEEVGDIAEDVRCSSSTPPGGPPPPKSSLEMLLLVRCLEGERSESFMALSSSRRERYPPPRFRRTRSVTSSMDSVSPSSISAIISFDLSAASRLNLLMMSISLDRNSYDNFRLSRGRFDVGPEEPTVCWKKSLETL